MSNDSEILPGAETFLEEVMERRKKMYPLVESQRKFYDYMDRVARSLGSLPGGEALAAMPEDAPEGIGGIPFRLVRQDTELGTWLNIMVEIAPDDFEVTGHVELNDNAHIAVLVLPDPSGDQPKQRLSNENIEEPYARRDFILAHYIIGEIMKDKIDLLA